MSAVPLAIWLPLAGASLAFLLGRRVAPLVGLATSGATLVAALTVARTVWNGGPQRHEVGGWGAPLGIDLYADGLSALMLLMTAVVGTFVSLYAWGYFGRPPSPPIMGGVDDRARGPVAPPLSHYWERGGRGGEGHWTQPDSFWPLWLFLWAALNALFLSADVFNLYVGLEVMGLAAVALVVLAGGPVALMAGMHYLLAALLGSLAYLLGVALLYAAFGALDIQVLGDRMTPTAVAWAAAALMTVGLALKTALFPLHFWLPPAHANAPAPVSAVLSALVVKASFYLILRLWFAMFPEAMSQAAGQFLGILGAAAILWGSVRAIRQVRLKLVVAYSTVAQVGYLFLLIPLAAGPATQATAEAAAWSGGIYHALSHAVAKAAMFMAAGTMMHALDGDDQFRSMDGVAERLPVTTFAFGLAGISLVGLPPSGGFVAKWYLLSAALESGQWWWATVILVGGVLAAGYVLLFFGHAFRPATDEARFHPVPRSLEWTTMALALISLLLGLRAAEILGLLEIGLGP